LGTSLTIRRALTGEYEAIGQLTADAYAPVLTLGATDPYLSTLQDAAGRAEKAELWAAVRGDQLAGTITVCRPGGPYAEIATSDELEVRMLAVAPGQQRSSVGAALMSAVHATAEAEGFRAVVLSVIDTNRGAQAFYASLGYERRPERDWLPLPTVTLQVWQRILS
jgi:ribosomal protein S18 acetylase RimI-like enzyme